MDRPEDFKERFRVFLREEIPPGLTLPQWQFAYRQVMFLMGMKILEQFPVEAVGPDPQPPLSWQATHGGGDGGGGAPSYIRYGFINFPAFVLAMQEAHDPEVSEIRLR
jgi:hypothetical protein